MKSLVTVGLPFYNAEQTLSSAIECVLNQSYGELELLLINDGSTDGSFRIACEYLHDCRVKLISDGKNLGLAARLNQVVELANGEYIARFDADDLMSLKRFFKQIRYLEHNPEVDLVSCSLLSFGNDLIPIGVRGTHTVKYTLEGILSGRQGFLHAGLVARKSWYIRNKYNTLTPTGQDIELWCSALNNNDFKAHSLSEVLYFYREENNITKAKLLRAYRLQIKLINDYLSGYIQYRMLMKVYLKLILIKTINEEVLRKYLLIKRNTTNISEICWIDFNEVTKWS